MTDTIDSDTDLHAVLDRVLADRGGGWWNGFYGDRSRACPFFSAAPDENLAAWIDDGGVPAGRALDLGCGHGRNAIFLAQRGWRVDAVDFSSTALAWASERAAEAGVQVAWSCASVFDAALPAAAYDAVIDSGLFHHVAPHRRRQYVDLVTRVLKPGGVVSLTCFRPEGGSGLSDYDVYAKQSMGGGLGYTEDRVRAIWSRELDVEELRPMRKPSAGEAVFGESFLWALRARKPAR